MSSFPVSPLERIAGITTACELVLGLVVALLIGLLISSIHGAGLVRVIMT